MNNPQQPKVLLDNITELADTRKQELQTCLDNLQKSLKKAPKGLLRAQPHKNSFQYYIISERGDTKGKYLPRKEIRKAAAIAQRDYNAAVARIIGRKITALDNLTENYHPEEIDAAFTGLHPGRRALVTPIRESDEEFIATWQHLPYTGKPFEINAPEFFTSTGVRVRSKSEVIIAEALNRAGIPFRYEYPTSIKGWGTLYPDFTCLNTTSREEIIWEHFGLMNDPRYRNTYQRKMAAFAAAGYLPYINLITTFDDANGNIDSRLIEKLVKDFFL